MFSLSLSRGYVRGLSFLYISREKCPFLFSSSFLFTRDTTTKKALASKSSSSVDARLCVCFVRVRVFCQYSPRKSRSSLSNVYVPPLAHNFASLVLVFRRLGFKTLNKLKCAKKKALTKRDFGGASLSSHPLTNMSKRQQQQQSRRQKKTTATVAVEKNTNPCVVFVLLCCSLSIFLPLITSQSFFQPSQQLSFFSLFTSFR